jgi:hypothetical protein
MKQAIFALLSFIVLQGSVAFFHFFRAILFWNFLNFQNQKVSQYSLD